MKLFTKAIEAKAQAQFPLGNDLEKQVVVAKFLILWGPVLGILLTKTQMTRIIAGVFVTYSNGKWEAFQNRSWKIIEGSLVWVSKETCTLRR